MIIFKKKGETLVRFHLFYILILEGGKIFIMPSTMFLFLLSYCFDRLTCV